MEEKNPFAGIKTYDSYWMLWGLTALLLLLHFPVVLVMLLVQRAVGAEFTSFEMNIPIQLVIGGVSAFMLHEMGVSWRGVLADWRRQFLPDLFKALKYFGGYMVVVALMVAVLLGAYLLLGERMEAAMAPVTAYGETEGEMVRAAGSSPLRMLVSFFGICLVAPVVEELYFRRIFFTTLRARGGFWFSAVLSGLVFALTHGAAAPMLLPVGIYACWVYERERRLPVNIMLHSMVNFLMITNKMIG